MAEKEYIEREATQTEIKRLCEKYNLAYGEHHGGFAEKIANITNTVPTADVQEVRHGKWIKSKNERKCSLCGYFYFTNTDNFNFCPNCGAKMDKE